MLQKAVHEGERSLLSGNEAVALAACHAGVRLGTGYPGTPSTEILETFSRLGGDARWSPNEKVALEVGLGAAFGGGRALVTMKHVGLNVAADPLFTAAYTGVSGGLVIVSADDPGMASSQNEQDNRRYAVAAGVPMLEPADSQEAYDFTRKAFELSEFWRLPVILRMTTRVCHSKTVVEPRAPAMNAPLPHFQRDLPARVMIPAYARPAHRRLREKLARLEGSAAEGWAWRVVEGEPELGVITSGVSFMYVREAAPHASVLKFNLVHPLPVEVARRFRQKVQRCVVVEEGDPYLYEALRAAGIDVEPRPESHRFGELDVARVRRFLAGEPEAVVERVAGKPPQLCEACPYHVVYKALQDRDCIVAGDIGCYTLGVLPPYQAMDTCVCMGASIGVGLGLRHVLPPDQARRVVSVIGDSTFIHSGITGLVEMVYNPPPTGHVVIVLDNATTAMTGHQEHPGTGRQLNHEPTNRVVIEELARALGIRRVHVVEPRSGSDTFARVLDACLEAQELTVIVARRPCVLVAKRLRELDKRAAALNAR
ncbi:MAG: thiamine pyrophosphate-binding protein [Verrucomicrobia bacterium]|nr:MAG: thiamine pyrophosphate-binding protein [Verrucomicrobiota bacterium]